MQCKNIFLNVVYLNNKNVYLKQTAENHEYPTHCSMMRQQN